MRILHIIASLDESTGGPARSVPQTCVELAKLGLEIVIICQPSPKPVQVPMLSNLKVTYYSYGQLQAFAHRLKKSDADIIHLQHIWTPYISVMARAARKAGIPYLITPRGMLEPWIMARNPWKKKLAMALYQRRDLQKAALLHATCEAEKQHIRELGFRNEIVVIPNGLDLSGVPKAKQDYGMKKMVFLSRIHPKKGIELLLQAWKQLDRNDWTLEIAGGGEPTYVEQLGEHIKKEQLANVKLVGPQYGDAKWDFLKSADLFVLPTYSENFGIVVAEALAVGVPVITTTGTPWQELETQNCGWWIELSVENLATAIHAATALNNNQLQTMGKNGRQLVNTKYDIRAVAAELNRIYNQLLY